VGASANRALVPAARLRVAPYRGIVLVIIGRVVCTGFVASTRTVVTAAHCLTRDAGGGDFRLRKNVTARVRLLRGFSDAAGGSSFPACRVSRVWAHSRFVRSGAADRRYGSRAHDYAVLTTTAGCAYPRDAVLPMLATAVGDGALSSGRTIRMAGYPSDARFRGMTGLNLWRSQGKVRPSTDPAILEVTGFVAQGMSGAPVWRPYPAKKSPCGKAQCVVAIVTECAINGSGQCRLGDSERRAVRITSAVKRTIRAH
jgi:V8-like Glu-specific endopeptidase